MSGEQIHDLSSAVRDRLIGVVNRSGAVLPDTDAFEPWCAGIAALGDPGLIRYGLDLLGNYAQNHADADASRAAMWARCWRLLDDALQGATRSVTVPDTTRTPT